MLIAQLTDLHLTEPGVLAQNRVDTRQRLAAAIDALNRSRDKPDVILFTGDLADKGHPDAYGFLCDRLGALSSPFFLIPGNHDDHDAMRKQFPDRPGMRGMQSGGFIQYTVDDFPVRLIGLDTTVKGSDSGLLCADRLGWLDERLGERPDTPTLIFMHHPPFRTGIDELDSCGLDNSGEFAAVVRQHPQVRRIVCGHVHRSVQTLFAGVPASVAPSTAFSHPFGLGPDADKGFTIDSPKYDLHLWTGEAFVTHTIALEDQTGPIPFT